MGCDRKHREFLVPLWGRLGMLMSAVWLLLGCQRPCDRLDGWAAQCGVPVRWNQQHSSAACRQVQDEFGVDYMDAYADCITALACDDQAGLLACIVAAAPTSTPLPCDRLKLWGAACGLEPAGTANHCEVYQGLEQSRRFDMWVECISGPGCPDSMTDARFSECDTVFLPDALTQYAQACGIASAHFMRCYEYEYSLSMCLALAQQYTPASYLAYAQCLDRHQCSEMNQLAACEALKQPPDSESKREVCSAIMSWAAGCGVNPSVGADIEGCMASLARFSVSSASAYQQCVTRLPCSQAANAALCLQLLELEGG